VADLTEKLLAMQARVAVLTRRSFGRSSEVHHPDQQQLDELMRQVLVDAALQPDESTATTVASAVDTTATTATATTSAASTRIKPRIKRRGRLVLPAICCPQKIA
jgi:Transposase C of IS166 homeodomain